MSSLLVGFCILLITNQQLTGSNNDNVTAFYAAEAGMEQMTAISETSLHRPIHRR